MSKILSEAQKGERPIHITEFDPEPGSLYSGITTLDDPKQITISINKNLPRETAENNLVHELFHVILFKEGFRQTAGSFKFREPGDIGRLYSAIALQLTNCFVDPLIDQRMAKRGFRPYLVTQLTADGLASTKSSDVRRSSEMRLWDKYAAMQLYCLSLRSGKFDMTRVRKPFAVVPTIIDQEKVYKQGLPRPRCGTPNDCFTNTRALRALAGIGPDILLLNPGTGTYE